MIYTENAFAAMEEALRYRIMADGERRNEKAARKKDEFMEALYRARTERKELERLKGELNGLNAATERDRLTVMMMGL
ncbi:MAG: hypothetical protein Q4E65_03895 [Clostridia bacterium]|nr:hypothetical protein [Clostridia bacterium]